VKAEVAGKVDEAAIIDDALRAPFAGDGGLHPIIEDLARHAADRVKSSGMAAQHGWQILMQYKPSPDQTAMSEHHGEQPDDARRCRLIGKDDMELGEIDLGLLVSNSIETGPLIGAQK